MLLFVLGNGVLLLFVLRNAYLYFLILFQFGNWGGGYVGESLLLWCW